MPGAGTLIDATRPLADHPLNEQLVAEWSVIPNSGWRGAIVWRNIVYGTHYPTDSTGKNDLSSGVPVFHGAGGRPGGYGSVAFTSANNQYGSVAGAAGVFQFNRSFAISAWIYPTTVSSTHGIISHGQNGWYLRLSSGKVDFLESNVADIGTGATTLTVNTWYHVGVSVDSAGGWVIYVDGVSDASGSTTHTFNGSTVNVTIGADQTTGASRSDYWGGSMDSVMLHNRWLSAGEFSALYRETKSGNPNRWNWISDYPAVFGVPAAAPAYNKSNFLMMGF